jgi:methylthioribose-1-phosphate isomerase
VTELLPDLRPIHAENGTVLILDQTLLPYRERLVRLATLDEAATAIRSMQVRGAPLIGVTAAYGLALAMRADASDAALDRATALLAATRPTAVNLRWALERVRRRLEPLAPGRRAEAAWDEAQAIAAEDAQANAAIGRHGLALIENLAAAGKPLNVMTHCNAGWLATAAHGTALAPVYAAKAAGLPIHVWVSETRPRNQGLLTAWELGRSGVPHTLIADNAAGLLLRERRVDAVIVGADRIARNGDVANKVGTYLKALAAAAAGVPFYVAAPGSTIDWSCPDGGRIPIEERDGGELRRVAGLDAAGGIASLALVSETTQVANPAFDVTPAGLVTAIVCERGAAAPGELAALFPERA